MTELSFAAQVVLDAANASATNAWSAATHQRFRTGVADALRAVVNQMVPTDELYARSCCEFTADSIRNALLAIADELEAAA